MSNEKEVLVKIRLSLLERDPLSDGEQKFRLTYITIPVFKRTKTYVLDQDNPLNQDPDNPKQSRFVFKHIKFESLGKIEIRNLLDGVSGIMATVWCLKSEEEGYTTKLVDQVRDYMRTYANRVARLEACLRHDNPVIIYK